MVYSDTMKPLTIRVREDTKESLESEASEYDVSVSEYVRELLAKGREYDDLQERLDSREDRISELEEQLAKRSQIEEKVDTLAKQVEGSSDPSPPWPVRWYQYFRSSGSA